VRSAGGQIGGVRFSGWPYGLEPAPLKGCTVENSLDLAQER
jgi:hypothetical protein